MLRVLFIVSSNRKELGDLLSPRYFAGLNSRDYVANGSQTGCLLGISLRLDCIHWRAHRAKQRFPAEWRLLGRNKPASAIGRKIAATADKREAADYLGRKAVIHHKKERPSLPAAAKSLDLTFVCAGHLPASKMPY